MIALVYFITCVVLLVFLIGAAIFEKVTEKRAARKQAQFVQGHINAQMWGGDYDGDRAMMLDDLYYQDGGKR